MHIPRKIEAHFGNHIWSCLWFQGRPVAIYRYEDFGHTVEEVEHAIEIVNIAFRKAVGKPKDAFYLAGRQTPLDIQDVQGVLLFRSIPDWVMSKTLYSVIEHVYSSLPTHYYPSLGESPEPQPELNEAYIWPLEASVRASETAYGIGGLVHELLHALGIADHYYMLDRHGKEGVWYEDSVLARPGLIFPTEHDIEDIARFYKQKLHNDRGNSIYGYFTPRPWWLFLWRR